MNKQKLFVDFVDYLIANCKEPVTMSDEVEEFYEALKSQVGLGKPVLTEQGIIILQYLQDHPELEKFKAKDVASSMGMTSRKLSGSMRKLVSDGFVDKFGSDPVIYSLSEQGKNFDLSTAKGDN